MINDAHRYLLQEYFFNERSTAIATIAQQQGYPLPYNYSKLKTGTLTIGNLKWTPTEILTREEWDNLNVFPYYSDIPNNFFIYDGKFNLWPIPSTTGNVIAFNYQIRVPDLSIADYSAGTVAVTNGSKVVTGTTTSWLATYLPVAGSVKNLNLWIHFTSPAGDSNWYQIDTIDSATQLTLLNNYDGANSTTVSYTIGQMPLLLEDFHDLPAYRALMIYFSTINKNPVAAKQFTDLYNAGIEQLDTYAGSKALQVDLSMQAQVLNPNIFPQNIG